MFLWNAFFRYSKSDSFFSDGRPLRGRSLQYWAFRRFVGLCPPRLRLIKDTPFGGNPAASGLLSSPAVSRSYMSLLPSPKGANIAGRLSRDEPRSSPRRGLLSITVGEEDEGRRAYGIQVHSGASSKGENIAGRLSRNEPQGSPRRGLLSIAVGEEDEGRRTYGTQVHSGASPKGANIG